MKKRLEKKLYKNASNNRDSKLRAAVNVYTFWHEIFENEKKSRNWKQNAPK